MNPVGKTTSILPLSGSALRHVGPRAQNASENADLYGKIAHRNARSDADDSLSTRAGPCQNGTEGFTPLWDGARLRPAFVAQLLGQLFPYADVPDPRFASAYRRYGSRKGVRYQRIA